MEGTAVARDPASRAFPNEKTQGPYHRMTHNFRHREFLQLHCFLPAPLAAALPSDDAEGTLPPDGLRPSVLPCRRDTEAWGGGEDPSSPPSMHAVA